MRERLKPLLGVRGEFTGKVKRFGTIIGLKSIKTVILSNIKYSGKVVTGHLWFTVEENIASAQLAVGDCVSFVGTVAEYMKVYNGDDWDNWAKYIKYPYETDYCIKYLDNVKKISEDEYNA